MSLPIPTEADEMRTLADYLDLRRFLWLHPANEGQRRTGHVPYGVKKGAQDVFIFNKLPDTPAAPHASENRGVAIELKRTKGGTVTADQLRWFTDLSNEGWLTYICKGAAEAIHTVEQLWPLR